MNPETFISSLFDDILRMVPILWPLFALGVGMILVIAIYRLWQIRRLAESRISDIDRMSGEEFERYLEVLFSQLGYQKVERTRYTGDYGADLIVDKYGVKTAIQAKRSNSNVGVTAVQEVAAARAKYECTRAMVVTNSWYTDQARQLARANGVELWDRTALADAILSVNKHHIALAETELPQAASGDKAWRALPWLIGGAFAGAFGVLAFPRLTRLPAWLGWALGGGFLAWQVAHFVEGPLWVFVWLWVMVVVWLIGPLRWVVLAVIVAFKMAGA